MSDRSIGLARHIYAHGDRPEPGKGIIEGERVILRDKRLSDAEHDYAWRCNPELSRLDAAQPLQSPFSTFLRRYQEELKSPLYQWRRMGIDTREGRHIGNCVYHCASGVISEAELGIMIGDPEYRDKGYGVDVITAVTRHIFSTLDVERIYLHTLTWNLRAQKCFIKCGFAPCGEVIRGGYTFLVMDIRRSKYYQRLAKPVGGRKA